MKRFIGAAVLVLLVSSGVASAEDSLLGVQKQELEQLTQLNDQLQQARQETELRQAEQRSAQAHQNEQEAEREFFEAGEHARQEAQKAW